MNALVAKLVTRMRNALIFQERIPVRAMKTIMVMEQHAFRETAMLILARVVKSVFLQESFLTLDIKLEN